MEDCDDEERKLGQEETTNDNNQHESGALGVTLFLIFPNQLVAASSLILQTRLSVFMVKAGADA